MEQNYIQATSDNLPVLSVMMLHEFYLNNMDYLSAEIRSAKAQRSTREEYGDDAVGYVQLKRELNVCTVKANITPEHKVRSSPYSVLVSIDEEEKKILSATCLDCAASEGGCKHSIAFIYWLHRRSEEPSPTSTECYWKKATLSKVGTSIKFVRCSDFKKGEPQIFQERNVFLREIIRTSKKENNSQLLKYFSKEESFLKLSLHHLSWLYKENKGNITNVSSFLEFCKENMTTSHCKEAQSFTTKQSKCSEWYELRFGRITASKVYEAAHCKTYDGALFESLLGATSIIEKEPMKRGKRLEDEIFTIVAQKMGEHIEKAGLFLNKNYPIFGASPDGLGEDFCLEIKCPFKQSTVKNYVNAEGEIAPKVNAQIQLQMLFAEKEKGILCIASPDFEVTKSIQLVEVNFNQSLVTDLIEKCNIFWTNAIFPNLMK